MKKFTPLLLIISSIIFTALVVSFDVRPIGPNNSEVGFAVFNQAVFNMLGVHMIFYHITDWIGIIPIIFALVYAIIGLVQLIERRSIKKVDIGLLALGVFYVIVFALYIFFNEFVINFRPILIDNYLEASYPSSHTMIVLCLCGSAIIVNRKLIKNKRFESIVQILLIMIALITIVGRILSGVHWATDIIGGLIIAAALLSSFRWFIDKIHSNF